MHLASRVNAGENLYRQALGPTPTTPSYLKMHCYKKKIGSQIVNYDGEQRLRSQKTSSSRPTRVYRDLGQMGKPS